MENGPVLNMSTSLTWQIGLRPLSHTAAAPLPTVSVPLLASDVQRSRKKNIKKGKKLHLCSTSQFQNELHHCRTTIWCLAGCPATGPDFRQNPLTVSEMVFNSWRDCQNRSYPKWNPSAAFPELLMEAREIVLTDKLQPGFIIVCLMERKLQHIWSFLFLLKVACMPAC